MVHSFLNRYGSLSLCRNCDGCRGRDRYRVYGHGLHSSSLNRIGLNRLGLNWLGLDRHGLDRHILDWRGLNRRSGWRWSKSDLGGGDFRFGFGCFGNSSLGFFDGSRCCYLSLFNLLYVWFNCGLSLRILCVGSCGISGSFFSNLLSSSKLSSLFVSLFLGCGGFCNLSISSGSILYLLLSDFFNGFVSLCDFCHDLIIISLCYR